MFQATQYSGVRENDYELVKEQALHLWEPSHGPNYSVGIGVGVFHMH